MKKLILSIVLVFVILLPGRASSSEDSGIEAWLLAATRAWQSYFSIPAMYDAIDKTKMIVPAETLDEHAARRARIVSSVWRAARDPNVPVIFSGPRGRELTALFVLAIWKEESHFDLRVDKYHCAGLPSGSCDGGHAYCLGQVHPKDVPQLGLTGAQLEADNFDCARATIVRLAAAKSGTPKEANPADRFCGYAVGHFETPCPPMRFRYSHAASWSKSHPVP